MCINHFYGMNTTTKIKALGLLSGGLDSTLAAKLMIDQNIEVHAINFTSPFCTCTPKSSGCSSVISAVKQLGDIPLKRLALKDSYLDIVMHPKHGHGRGMNPCLDCRILKIKKAAEYMKEIGASFLFTGEVLGQRPMSQHRRAITIIDAGSGVGELTLRPLSAAHFEPTLPEKNGWVDRDKLLAIEGRSRKEQISLAKEKDIRDYPCPAGGCLLTDRIFAERLKDYFSHTETPSLKEINLLKVGRHFRLDNGDNVIVARNEAECNRMETLCKKEEYLYVPDNFSGPTVILQGSDTKSAISKLLEYTNSPIPGEAVIVLKLKGESFKLKKSDWEKRIALQ